MPVTYSLNHLQERLQNNDPFEDARQIIESLVCKIKKMDKREKGTAKRYEETISLLIIMLEKEIAKNESAPLPENPGI